MFEFAHINIVAYDWKKLAQFYLDVFHCVEVPPKRELRGEWIENATNVPGAAIEGMHLLLPTKNDSLITLEIFQYNKVSGHSSKTTNRPGFAHIAFRVDDVEATMNEVLAHGGSRVGSLERRTIEGAGTIVFTYVADPEGNIIELQRWL